MLRLNFLQKYFFRFFKMEMRLSMKIGKRIFFRRPGRLLTFLRFKLAPRAEVCGGENLPLRPRRNLAPGKIHACARGANSNPTNFDLAPRAQAPFSETLPLRPRRWDV